MGLRERSGGGVITCLRAGGPAGHPDPRGRARRRGRAAGRAGLSGVHHGRAGRADRCSKTTMYKHWRSRAELVAAAVQALASDPAVPDTGDVRGDLIALTADSLDAYKGAAGPAWPASWKPPGTTPNSGQPCGIRGLPGVRGRARRLPGRWPGRASGLPCRRPGCRRSARSGRRGRRRCRCWRGGSASACTAAVAGPSSARLGQCLYISQLGHAGPLDQRVRGEHQMPPAPHSSAAAASSTTAPVGGPRVFPPGDT